MISSRKDKEQIRGILSRVFSCFFSNYIVCKYLSMKKVFTGERERYINTYQAQKSYLRRHLDEISLTTALRILKELMFFANVTHKRGSIDSFHPTWLSISILMRPRKKPFKIIGLFFFSFSFSLFLPCHDKPRALISPHPGPGFSFRGFTRDNSRVPRD